MTTKLPPIPANTQAEAAILAHIFVSPKSLDEVADTLTREHFYLAQHADIYTAMLALRARGRVVTLPNVEDELRRTGLITDRSEEYDLERLFAGDSVEYMTPLADHIEKVRHAATCRAVISRLDAVYQAAWRQDADVAQQLEEVAYQIALGTDTKSVQPLSSVLERYMVGLDERREEYVEGSVGGLPTGFRALDRMLGGLRRARLYTLAAMTGYGKTSYALNIAVFMALHARHVLFFSAEMEDDELAERILSMVAEIPQDYLRDGNVDDSQYTSIEYARSRLAETRFEIDDSTHLLSEMRSKARKVQARDPLDLIVVDYLQLLDLYPEGRAKNEQRWEEIGKVSKELKRMARELKVPVLALAQMSRASEKRANDLPLLSDLAEGAGIERNSDAVIFLYVSPTEGAKREKSEPYQISVIVRKQRHGRVGTVEQVFRPRLTRFEDSGALEGTVPYADD